MKATRARRDRDGFKAVTDTLIEHTSGWSIEYRDGHWRVTDAGRVVRGDFTSLNEAKGVALYYIDSEA